ncbi:MAG: S8 family serine peptidase [Lacibacter sp.]
MQKIFLLFCLMFSFLMHGRSQSTKHVVFFTEKNETPFTLNNPSAYLSARSVERRTRYGIVIDSTDLPVISRYIDSVLKAGTVTLLGRSRWLNAIIIQTNDAAAITKINSFPFVKSFTAVALLKNNIIVPDKFAAISVPAPAALIPNRIEKVYADTFNYGSSSSQVKIHKGEFLHNIGARGQGMIMAFLDAGFFGYETNQFFDSARVRNQFLGTWDFVQNNASVNEDNSHGMQCFSTVAAFRPGVFVGSSPEAKYFLLRTEDAPTEQIIEEYNWALAAEYADSAGVDVISSSLGYTTFDNATFNHTYADMNGNTTIITRIADMAAKKGMLVVNSAGNEGDDPWKYIGAPADGDSVLSVGAVNSSGVIAGFSSFGPTSDGQIKPDVVSLGAGTTVSSIGGTVSTNSGTSFSGPNMAGLATCLWQLFPEFNNWKIITTLRKSSDRFETPAEQYGYGLPDMKKAVGFLLGDISTMNASVTNCTADISWSSKDINTMRYDIERKLPGETVYTKIKTVAAKGTVFSSQNYQLSGVITSSATGNVSYRIKQVIDTSAATFDEYAIDSATLILSSACAATSVNEPNNPGKYIQLFPNPVQSSLTIRFTEQRSIAQLSIEIYNAQSQLVWKQDYSKPNGTITHTIPVARLAKGDYILVVRKDGKKYAAKEFLKL